MGGPRREGWRRESYEWTEDDWNQAVPVGTPVRYYPVARRSEFEETRTRSTAWTLGNGEAVVSVEGRSGGVSLAHLDVVVAPAAGPGMVGPEACGTCAGVGRADPTLLSGELALRAAGLQRGADGLVVCPECGG